MLVPQDRQLLGAMPKSAHPGAKKALAQIWNAEDREHARRAVAAFKLAYGGKFVKAVAKVVDDLDELLAFYDFPAEYWVHLRTTNPIDLRDGPAPDQGHQRTGLESGRARDGVQADRSRSATVASGQRTAPGRPRACRRPL